jgi:hypothetical protein
VGGKVEVLLSFVVECIRYGFVAATLALVVFRPALESSPIYLPVLLNTNNLLRLIGSVFFFAGMLYTVLAAWYSQSEFAEYAIANRLAGPFWMYALVPFLAELLVLVMLASRQRRALLRYSIAIAAIEAVFMLFSVIPAIVFVAQTAWNMVAVAPYLAVLAKALLYLFVLGLACVAKLKFRTV